MTEMETTEERILDCLAGLEILADMQADQDGWNSIASRIYDITNKCMNWFDFTLYNHLLYKIEHTPVLYQQMLYQMIPHFTQDDKVISHLTKGLLGENNEYYIEPNGLFIDELYDEVYDICVRDHMESYRAGYFEKEDLVGEDLERHLEFVAYAKENGL